MLLTILVSALMASEPTLAERPIMPAYGTTIDVEKTATQIRAGVEGGARLVYWRVNRDDAKWSALAPGELVPDVGDNTMAVLISRSPAGVYAQVFYTSLGDVDEAAQYFFAPTGRLVRFTQTSSGFGDICGEFRVDLQVDYPTPTRGIRTFDHRQGDGTPVPQEYGCEAQTAPFDPSDQPLWLNSSDLPNKGAW
jgi:hypothetical protein